MSKDLKICFENTFRDILSHRLTLKQIIASDIPVLDYFYTIKMSLQAVQNQVDSQSAQPVGLYWNPIIAASLTMAENLGQCGVSPSPCRVTNTSKQTTQKGKKTPGTPKPRSVTTSPSCEPSTISVNDNNASKPNSPKSKSIPTASLPEVSPDYDGFTKLLNSGVALYAQACHSHVKCTDPTCKFCRAVFAEIRITPCSDHTGPPCHVSNCYPHIGRPLWARLRKSHATKQVFRSTTPKVLKVGTFLSISETRGADGCSPVIASYSPQRVNKRHRLDVDSDPETVPASPKYEPDSQPPADFQWADDSSTE